MKLFLALSIVINLALTWTLLALKSGWYCWNF